MAVVAISRQFGSGAEKIARTVADVLGYDYAERELISAGIKETFRGKAWSKNAREWVYFDCVLELESIKNRINLDPCVRVHQHYGTHDGQESGFVCTTCWDAIMGAHPDSKNNTTVYR